MNKFYSVFLVAVSSCTFAFAQSTNIVGGGSVDLSGFQFSGSGDSPTNYAANVENVTDLLVAASSFDGGAGGTTTEGTGIVAERGGNGLQLTDVDLTTVSDSVFTGGSGGSVTVAVASSAEGNGGHGVELNGSSPLRLENGVVATGGNGGSINNSDGRGRAFGGDGVHYETGDIVANLVVSNGTYQGGTGGNATYNSDEVNANFINILQRDLNGARGGHGLFIIEPNMFKDFSRSLTITNGTFVGGNGGVASNQDESGDVIADGGSGVFVTSMDDVKIFGGTFVGGQAGTTNGAAAQSGYGAAFWDSNVVIDGGDFQGDSAGLLFSSYFYESILTINSGRFDNVEIQSINGFFQGNTIVNISGGDTGNIAFGGDNTIDADITGGIVGNISIDSTSTLVLSLGTNATTSGKVVQYAGTTTVDEWSNQHFMDTTIYDGTINFTDLTHNFNLADGSSFSVLDDGTVDFGGGFTAESGSQITTTYDGTNASKIAGGALEFKAGTKWTINGVSSITNKTKITMASGASVVSGLVDSDVDYIGGSWAAGLTLGVVGGNELIGTYGFVDLEDGLGLEAGTDFYVAMEQLSMETGFSTSDDDEFTALKGLSQEAANTTLQEQFVNNPMVGAMIQLQSTFADQIKDRTRSHLRYKGVGTSPRSPQGALGPDAWNRGVDSLNNSLPSWDARNSLKSADEKAPSWDVSQSMRNMDDRAPKPSDGKISVPATYQVWGRGYGSYFKQGDTSDLVGYDATVGGGVLGMDKRFNNLLLGLGGGYANTTLNGNGGGEDKADTFYGTAYAALTGEKGFLDFNLNYAFNEIETEGSAVSGSYESDYNANTFSMYFGGGRVFSAFNDSVLITPEASFLTTYYTRDSYTETAASPDPWPTLEWDSYDQWSYLSSLGATFSMIQQIESFNLEMQFQPEIRAHWLHEFNADMDNDSYIMGGQVTPIGVAVRTREEDLVKVGAGVRFSKWGSDTLEFGLDLDGVFGNDYEAYVLSGKLLHRF